jgi:hypothetical protein
MGSSIFGGTSSQSPSLSYNIPLPNINNTTNFQHFPPNIPVNSNIQNAPETSYLRGQLGLENLPPWEREERLLKLKNQQDIQAALKKQITDKDNEKRRLLNIIKVEEERDQAKVEAERVMLNEMYAREKETARIKGVLKNFMVGKKSDR